MVRLAIRWGLVSLLIMLFPVSAIAAPPANQQGQRQIDALYQEWKKGLEVDFEKFTQERLKDLTLNPQNMESLQADLDKLFGKFPTDKNLQPKGTLPSNFGDLQSKVSDLPDPKQLFNITNSSDIASVTKQIKQNLPDFPAVTTAGSLTTKQPVLQMPDASFFENFKKRLPQWNFQLFSSSVSDPLSIEELFRQLGVKIPAEHLKSLGVQGSLPPNMIGSAWDRDFEKRIEALKAGMPPMPAPKELPELKLNNTYDKYFKDVENLLNKARSKMGAIEKFLNQPLDIKKLQEFLNRPVITKETFSNLAKKFGSWDTKNSVTFNSPELFYYGP